MLEFREKTTIPRLMRESLNRAAFRTAHTAHPGLGSQFVQQCLGLLEVGGVEAFGEPVVDFGQHRVRFVAAADIAQQAGEAHGCVYNSYIFAPILRASVSALWKSASAAS